MQGVLETGHDTEIAATASEGPEEVGMVGVVGHDELTVDGDELHGEHRVDGQTVLAGEEADPTTECDATDPDRTTVAESDGEPVLGGGGTELGGSETGPGPCRGSARVDFDMVETPDIDHDPAVDDAVAGHAVTAAADRELEARRPGESDGRGDIGAIRDANDGGRADRPVRRRTCDGPRRSRRRRVRSPRRRDRPAARRGH